MKHLLMLIPFFPPMGGGGVYRPLSFVRYLPSCGWRTTVVTPAADAYWILDETLAERVPRECRVIRTGTLSGQWWLSRARRGRPGQTRSTRGFGLARRTAAALLVPDTYVGWYPFAVRAALEVTRRDRVDALYSTSPPESTHLAALAVQRRTRLPWVADFRDPWMNLHLLRPPSSLHARLHRRMEARVCAHAHVVVTTRWHEAMLRREHPAALVTRVSNGYDGDDVRSVDPVAPPPRPFRIVHAGTLTQRRSAGAFLEALSSWLAARPELRAAVEVEFIGPREDENERAVSRLGLGDVVRFRDTLAHAEALRVERSAHVLLLLKHADARYDGVVPGKLYEYIGLRRPVLALAPPGEAHELVRSLRRGETASPSDVGEIRRALETLFERYRGGTLETSYDLSERPAFDRARLSRDLAAVLDRAAPGGAP